MDLASLPHQLLELSSLRLLSRNRHCTSAILCFRNGDTFARVGLCIAFDMGRIDLLGLLDLSI